jgi:(R,R)-butanediol dehydrogenase / meso-butanediol dehydrogenase / diacetyl reductase
MKTLRYYGKKDIRLEDVPEPIPASEEVVIRIAACGICGTDLHTYLQEPPPGSKSIPMVLGHEFSGTIDAVGGNVRNLTPNDRVTVNPGLYCRKCGPCRRGQFSGCKNVGSILGPNNGGFARMVAVPASACHMLPPTVGMDQGAMVELLAVAVHGYHQARLNGSERIAVFGAGPLGLLMLLVLKEKGFGPVVVIEPGEKRRTLALKLGADGVIDPIEEHGKGSMADFLSDESVTVVFECSGNPQAFSSAFNMIGMGGRIVQLGACYGDVPINLFSLLLHEKEIIGSVRYNPGDFPEAIDLLASGNLDVTPLITARIPLEAAVSRGFEALLRPEEGHVKILVTPN